MKKVAISACLIGEPCKYNGEDNLNSQLMAYAQKHDWLLVPFCPEDDAFGTPRPTMDLIEDRGSIEAICNMTGKNLTQPIESYAINFFTKHPDIDIFVGKSKSPSCGVCSARLYDRQKNLISNQSIGIMAREAQKHTIDLIDSSTFEKEGV